MSYVGTAKAIRISSLSYSYTTGGSDDPTITVASNSLAVENQVTGQYDGSKYSTLEVEGSNLTDNVILSLTDGDDSAFEMTTDLTNWTSSLTLTQSGESLTGEVAIRLKDNLAVDSYTDDITLTSTGATSVTVNLSGSVTAPPTYTVTYAANGGTGTMTDTEGPYLAGATVTLLLNSFTAPEGQMWSAWQVKDADNIDVTVTGNQFTMPASNVTVTAQWIADPDAPQYEWVLTPLADLTATDVFVIVGNDSYAMASTLVSNTQPAAVSVSIQDDKIAGIVADNLKWNVTGNTSDGYTFHPNGDATNYLYCNTTASSGSNTNMRIGTQSSNIRNLFVLENEHLATKDSYTKRYIHLNGSTDWRGYVSSSTSSTTVKFYKRQVVSTDPSVTLAEYEISVPAEGGDGILTVQYANINEVVADIQFYEEDSETITTAAYYEDWLTAEIDEDNNVSYSADENTGTGRTAYFKVYALDNNAENVYSEMITITQAAPEPKYTATVASGISNGTVMIVSGTEQVSSIEVEEGTEVTLTATPNSGYALNAWNVYKADNATVTVTVINNKFTMPAYDVVISATFVEATTYTLITSIDELVSGKHYIIASGENGTVKAMGGQNTNNRVAVEVISNDGVVAKTDGVYEFVIIGPDADGFYTIYDVDNTEYLYAAGSDNNNHLKKQSPYDNNGRWSISFNENAAIIVAQGDNTNKYMRFNNTLFSCYKETSSVIALPYLYAKNNEATVSCEMAINGYSNSTNPEGGYYLIASPFGQTTPTNGNGFLANNYDLYAFDQSQEQEWRNYKVESFNLVSGHGYLYANSGEVTLNFEGYPYVGSGQVFLSYTEGNNWAGWNLIGNPFNAAATIPDEISYYTMNEDGSDLTPGESYSVGAKEGIFVLATGTEQFVTFTQGAKGDTESCPRLSLNLSSNGKLADRAIVRLGEGQTLPKFMLDERNTKLYFTEGNRDYAVVRSEAEGELPVNFKAKKNGTYTISVETNDIEAKHLHLIDNMTGIDIDLLATPSYTFNAKTTDYASRFRLVFSTTGVDENGTEANFAYFNGTEWVIDATENATVELIDMTGRTVAHGTRSVGTNGMAQGVYVLRLVDNNSVKTQKIVVR